MSLDDVLASMFGPKCEASCGMRTRNPSRICTRCLGSRCCFKCDGTGAVWPAAALGPSGCGRCSGSGISPCVPR